MRPPHDVTNYESNLGNELFRTRDRYVPSVAYAQVLKWNNTDAKVNCCERKLIESSSLIKIPFLPEFFATAQPTMIHCQYANINYFSF